MNAIVIIVCSGGTASALSVLAGWWLRRLPAPESSYVTSEGRRLPL